MSKFTIRVPECVVKVSGENKREAINKGFNIAMVVLNRMKDNGDIYGVPEICKEVGKRNGMEELGREMPIKPSRFGKRRR